MGQVLARILMWGIIIALVWYFAQQWNQSAPSEQQHQAMMEAARSYQEYKAQQGQNDGGGSVPPENMEIKSPDRRF